MSKPIRGSKKLAGELERAIHELLAALDRTNNPLQEVLSQRSPIGVKKKAPLAKFVDLADLPGRMRQWLVDHNVVYAEDVAGIDLRSLPEAPGLGKVALGKFFAILEHDLHPDVKALQEVIFRYGIKTKPNASGYW